jgi:6-phosphogluconolactonase
MTAPEVQPYRDAEALARAAAELFVTRAAEAMAARQRFGVALSGGSSPKAMHAVLTQMTIDWSRVHIFWGDERCVPPTDAESNYRMVNDALLQFIRIPGENVHRIVGERNPAEAASLYGRELRQVFGLQEDGVPRFDLMLLGLGEDGHTASLFPGTSALGESEKLVTMVYVEELNAHRVTLTFPVINNSRHVVFLVSGKSKAPIVREVLQNSSLTYPAQLVRPLSGELHWLVDQDAASQLEIVNQQ